MKVVFKEWVLCIYNLNRPDYIAFHIALCNTTKKVSKLQYRNTKEVGGSGFISTQFKYLIIVSNHFQYCNTVDTYNRRRIFPIVFKE